jgi:lipoprotein
MIMKALTKISIGFLALVAVALWFTSCSSEDVAQNGGSQSDKESLLTLTINTGKIMGSRTTDWTSDPAGTDASQNESKISEITIGIFDGTTKNVKAIIEPKKGTGTTPKDNEFTYNTENKKITAKVIAKALSANDDVLVAVNHAGKFGSVSDEKSFNAVTESLSEALGTGTSQDNTHIPMYGTGKLVAGTSANSFTAGDIVVKRLLAKITLDKLSVDFSGIYASAEFTPTCCFLINVLENLKFADGKDSWNMAAALNSGWAKYDGTFDYTTQNDNIGTGVNFKPFLTTGNLPGTATALKGAKNSGTEAYGSKVYFYTMPNGNDKASAKNTKLVIAGKFKANSTAQEQMVYYPVPLNVNIAADGAETPCLDDKYKVYPNKNYKCAVTIKTIGVANPNLNLDKQDATITIKVEDWTSVSQTTIFD